MCFDGGEDLFGTLHRGKAIFGRYFRTLRRIYNGIQKRFLLDTERLLVVDIQLLDMQKVGPVCAAEIHVAGVLMLLYPFDDIDIGISLYNNAFFFQIVET